MLALHRGSLFAFPLALSLLATTAPVRAAALLWTGTENSRWDTSSANWSGPTNVFQTGDSVLFDGSPWPEIIVQPDTPPFAVFPSSLTLGTNLPSVLTFRGGDIASGSIEHMGQGFVAFLPSRPLSFPGNAITHGGIFVLDTTSLPDTNAAGLGAGTLVLDGGYFILRFTNSLQVLLNNVRVTTNGASFDRHYIGESFRPFIYRLAGGLELGGYFRVGGYGLVNGPNHLDGALVVDQSAPSACVFDVRSYAGFFINGAIRDGPGPASNALQIINREIDPVRIANPSNTYAGGTVLLPGGFEPYWLSNNWGNVEVSPGSSLGFGPVTIESNAALRLTSNDNIAHDQSVTVRGFAYITNGVKIRLASLTLGDATFSSGLFPGTNTPHLLGGGSFRVPTTNLAPSITLTSPAPGQSFVAGDAVPIRAQVLDADSYVTNVAFYVNGLFVGQRTEPPFQWFHLNAMPGDLALHAVAYDDDGGVTTSAVVNVTVANTGAPRELIWTGALSREWNTAAANWNDALVFHAGDSVRFTDAGAGNVFIGNSGFPIDVTVGEMVIVSDSNYVFSGGLIRGSGSLSGLSKSGSGTASFTNLTASQPFAGPVSVGRGALELVYGAPQLSLQFGGGPIGLHGGTLRFRPRTGANGQTSSLLNPLGVLGVNSTLNPAPIGNARCVWGGGLSFASGAALNIVADAGGGIGVSNHAISGVVSLNGTNGFFRHTGHGNTAFALLGSVVDGALPGTLLISNNTEHAFRLGGSGNIYSGGTVVLNCGAAITNPFNATYSVEVAPGACLGTGDVLVQSNALLRLLAGGSINPAAKLDVQGFVYIPGKVLVRVAQLTLAGQTFTNGTFGQTNSGGHIVGGGAVVVNASNAPPTVAFLNPFSNSTFTAGVTLSLRVNANDTDGFIARVDYLDGANLIGSATAPPYRLNWTNLPAGSHTITAVAIDNEGAQTVSLPVVVDALPFHLLASLMGPDLRLTFNAAANASYVVESSASVTGPWEWQTFVPWASTNRLIVVDLSPLDQPQGFFRARTSRINQ